MVSNEAISILRDAVGRLAVVKLSPEEEARVEGLAKELKTLLDAAVTRLKSGGHC